MKWCLIDILEKNSIGGDAHIYIYVLEQKTLETWVAEEEPAQGSWLETYGLEGRDSKRELPEVTTLEG